MKSDFFADWGSQSNPIRQSDLQNIFGSVYGCAKHFAFSKLYPSQGDKRRGDATILGDVSHALIADFLNNNPNPMPLMDRLDMMYGKVQIEEKILARYNAMLIEFFKTKEAQAVKSRILEAERSFMVQIGQHWIAGTIDAIIKGKKEGSISIIDWKTGKIKNQFEMDNSYQSRIYCYAVEHGEFFLKPEKPESGKDYYESWSNTLQRNSFKVRPMLYYAYLQDLIPAQRESKRKSDHYSAKPEDGYVSIAKGGRRGPFIYETKVPQSTERLEYTLDCATTFARLGIWPEYFGGHCKTCFYRQKCESLGSMKGERQLAMDLMNDLGIEPD